MTESKNTSTLNMAKTHYERGRGGGGAECILSAHLGILADLLVDLVDGGDLVVGDVDGDLGHVGLLQVPADGLHLLKTAGLGTQVRRW